jgi:hypothetical protein
VVELEHSRLADDFERLFRIVDAGKLHADLPLALALDLGLGHTKTVDAVLDDLTACVMPSSVRGFFAVSWASRMTDSPPCRSRPRLVFDSGKAK